MNITPKELAVLKAIRDNHFHDCQHPAMNPVWANCINESKSPSGIEGKALSGVVSNLKKKGLVGTDGECIWLTWVGFNEVPTDEVLEQRTKAAAALLAETGDEQLAAEYQEELDAGQHDGSF